MKEVEQVEARKEKWPEVVVLHSKTPTTVDRLMTQCIRVINTPGDCLRSGCYSCTAGNQLSTTSIATFSRNGVLTKHYAQFLVIDACLRSMATKASPQPVRLTSPVLSSIAWHTSAITHYDDLTKCGGLDSFKVCQELQTIF